MTERTAEQLWYFLRERQPQFFDEASENEDDREEIQEEVPDVQDVDEDLDFDSCERQVSEQEEHDEPEPQAEPQEGRPRRRRSIIRGKNNFKWSVNAPETQRSIKGQKRGSPRIYLPSAEDAAKDVETPLEAWSLLFTETMLESIVRHTNEEIESRAEFSTQLYYKVTDIVELKALLGLLYFGGIEKNNHSRLNEMWSPQFGYSLYKAVMTEHRFQFLLTCIRFDDKHTRRERRALHGLAPIKDLWEAFLNNCQKYYSPSTHCTIGEQLLGFRGSFGAKVFIPNKPDKYGIKIVMCNDAQTSYMIHAEPYVRRIITEDSVPSYYVKKLTEPIHNSERNVTCDNWFTSVSLVQEMKREYSLTMVGTMRKNHREIPASFTQTATAGTVRYGYADGMTLLSYCPKRNKVILLLSSLHQSGQMNEENGKPEIVVFYNQTKGGTDTFEQFCKNYTTSRITKRWPLRIFYGMLDQAGVNAVILYNLRTANNALTRRAFLKELILDLIKPHLQVRLQTPSLRRNIKLLICEILDVKEPDSQNKRDKMSKRKRCQICPSKMDKKTSYCCASCQKPLCEEHRTCYCNDCAV